MGTQEHESLFRQWLAEHLGLLIKVARSFADSASDTDDLLQEVLLQVWISLPNYRAESKPTTWLYRVALNTGLAWKRREVKHRRRRADMHPAVVAEAAASPDDRAANRETIDRMYAAIRELEPAGRALVLLYLDGLSYAEMAEVIGISENNIGVRLNRIRKQLAEALKGREDVA
ncbi:MAG: RNA polymerase sigma factor [Pirellulales bacterium]